MSSESLSLGSFDPRNTHAPYLNTPRSLEACRRHGIQPGELVEISIAEFTKDAHDNDPEIAAQIFDRVDGARKILLERVTDEWHRICSNNGSHNKNNTAVANRPSSAETIVDVPIESHSTLLEIQVAIILILYHN